LTGELTQPNQYLKNSKPFSELEKQVAVDPSLVENTRKMMILLKAATQDLRRSDFPIVDLTAIFSDTDETVYKDICCHLNDVDNQIMADAIVSNIMRSTLSVRVTPKAGPSAGSSLYRRAATGQSQ